MYDTVAIRVRGKVQGVWFRKFTSDKARELGLSGFVKNLADGSVFVLVTGPPEELKKMEDWCWTGSPASEVTDVTVKPSEAVDFLEFQIL